MRHLARGPKLLGIDSKPIAAGRRIDNGAVIRIGNEAAD